MGARNSGVLDDFGTGEIFRFWVCLAVNNVNWRGLVRAGLSFCSFVANSCWLERSVP
jgi:hypothetical protein